MVPEYCVLLCLQYSGTKLNHTCQHWYPNIACYYARSIRVPNMMSNHNIGTRILRAIMLAVFGYQTWWAITTLVPEYCVLLCLQYSGTKHDEPSQHWYPNIACYIARSIRVPNLRNSKNIGIWILRAIRPAVFGYQT